MDDGRGTDGSKAIGTDELLKAVAHVPAVHLQAGAYKLGDLLGKGGMGSVFVGEHEIFGRRAVKIISERATTEQREELEQRFKTEARALSQLDHPNIVRIYEFGHLDDGRPFFVMELLEGKSLRAILGPDLKDQAGARKRLPLPDALGYLEQICAGLQAAHERQIFHRDLKPDNIFVQRAKPPVAKILDFGVAKMLSATLVNLTKTGPLGTPLYMPPEQAEGRHGNVGAANDVYSVGVLLYRMLSGRLPFELPADFGRRVVAGGMPGSWPVVPLHDAAPHVPRALARVVDQCLEQEPDARPPSARVLWETCQDVASRAPSVGGGEGALKARASRSPLLMFALGGLLMAVVLGVVWLVARTS